MSCVIVQQVSVFCFLVVVENHLCLCPSVPGYLPTCAKCLLPRMKRITLHLHHRSRRHLACVKGASVCVCVCVIIIEKCIVSLSDCLFSPVGEVNHSEFHTHKPQKSRQITVKHTHTQTHFAGLSVVCACRWMFFLNFLFSYEACDS